MVVEVEESEDYSVHVAVLNAQFLGDIRLFLTP